MVKSGGWLNKWRLFCCSSKVMCACLRNRAEESSADSPTSPGREVGVLPLRWKNPTWVLRVRLELSAALRIICSCVVVGVGLLPIHFVGTFFIWVGSKLFRWSCEVYWSTVLWHLSIHRCRCVSLSNYILMLLHHFHTQSLFMPWALNTCIVLHVWSYLEFSIQ